MEVRREVSINEDGHQVTRFITHTQRPEIIFTIISNGEEILFLDTTPVVVQPAMAPVS